MKKLILLLTVFTLTFSFAQEQSKFYSKPTHFIFENYIGEWNVIYASYAEKMPPNGGRGTSTSSITLGGTILQFENKFNYTLGEIHNYYIIGWDKHNAQYYFLSYDNASESPYIIWGNYIAESKSFEFKTHSDKKEENDIRVEMKFVREDKLIINTFKYKEGKEIKLLETAFVK